VSAAPGEFFRDVVVVNPDGIHARPVMQLVALASRYESEIEFSNLSRRAETLNGKSPLDMMLLEATCGNVVRIHAAGPDAQEAVEVLAARVEKGFEDSTEEAVADE
jgi:phosphotransferase system HPr (HPr) family protein